MEIIDSHAHIYPIKIAKKATDSIGNFYNIKMELEGRPDLLIEKGKEAGISKCVVHSVATKAEQVRSINLFIKEEMDAHKEFIGFMTLHQDLSEEEVFNEIKWCKENGFKGIKLHPDFQKFYVDDENCEKLYKYAGEDFPVLLHMGDNRYDYSRPYRLSKIAKKYKGVNFIGAHFGGYRCWDEIDVYKGLNNVYFDTSSSLAFIGEKRAKEYIEKFGADRFFFGTDFPMWNPDEEIERFMKIDLSDDKKEMILSDNIKKLLKL